jgi:ASCH domain
VILPALSLRQPWAWLVLHGGKGIENRKWNTKLRGSFLIHAAKGMTRTEYDDAIACARDVHWALGNPNLRLPELGETIHRGGIVGAARIDNVWEPTSDSRNPWHFPDQFGFELSGITPLLFRPYTGALSFFRVELTSEEEATLRAAGLVTS